MATEAEVTRANAAGGEAFLVTERTSDSRKIQPSYITDNEGVMLGVPGSPFVVQQDGTVTIAGAITGVVSLTGTSDVSLENHVANSVPVNVAIVGGTANTWVGNPTSAAVNELVLKGSSGGTVYSVSCVLAPGTNFTRFLMLFDNSGSDPIPNGTTPLHRFVVPPNGQAKEVFGNGLPFTAGLVAVVSTTIDTSTQPASGEGYIFSEVSP